MNGASLLLAAFKWTLLGRVANPGPLMNGASPVGGEQARGDSPSPPPGPDEAETGGRGRSTPTLLSADKFNPLSVLLCASPITAAETSSVAYTHKKVRMKVSHIKKSKDNQRSRPLAPAALPSLVLTYESWPNMAAHTPTSRPHSSHQEKR